MVDRWNEIRREYNEDRTSTRTNRLSLSALVLAVGGGTFKANAPRNVDAKVQTRTVVSKTKSEKDVAQSVCQTTGAERACPPQDWQRRGDGFG